MDFKPLDVTPPRGAYYLANAFAYYLDKAAGTLDWLCRPAITGPDDCRTTDELLAFANRIRHSEPSFSADLIAAINRGPSDVK